jgi:hypothetical protein
MTGTSPTVTTTLTTPGVNVTHRSAPTGALLEDTVNGLLYQNTSATALQPTWTSR